MLCQIPNLRVARAACVALASVGCLLSLAGCANFSASPSSWFSNDTRDTSAGIVAPSETLAELKKLAKQAKGASPKQKRHTSEKLTEMIKREEDPALRAQIVRTLGHYDTLLAGDVLRASLRDSEAEVRVAGCRAWTRRAGKAAVRALGGALSKDDNIDVRLAAAQGLGQLGDVSAVAVLADALGEAESSWRRTDPALQYRIVQSLEAITGQGYRNNFEAWQQYARGARPSATSAEPTESLADKIRRVLPF